MKTVLRGALTLVTAFIIAISASGFSPSVALASSCSQGYLDIYENVNLGSSGGAGLRVCYGYNIPNLGQQEANEVCGYFFHRYWDNCISSVRLTSIGATRSVCLWTALNYSGNGLRIIGNWSGNFDGGLGWMNDNAESLQWNC